MWPVIAQEKFSFCVGIVKRKHIKRLSINIIALTYHIDQKTLGPEYIFSVLTVWTYKELGSQWVTGSVGTI